MKRLISVLIMICMVMTMGCFSASAANEDAVGDTSENDCTSAVVIGDSTETIVEDAEETVFETIEDDENPGVSPRITVPNGCVSCIKRIMVWPAHYDATDKTIRYSKDYYAFYTWAEATEFGGTLSVPTKDTANLMYAFTSKTGYTANAWRMQVTYNIYSDYYGSYPLYYDFEASPSCVANRTSDGTVRFECNGQPGHQSVYLTTSFTAPISYENQPEILLNGAFVYYDKTTKTRQASLSWARTLFNQ